MNRKAMSDFYWTIVFVLIIVLLGGGWLAFVVRAGSGAEIAQDYMVRNLGYLSVTMLSSPSIASYCFSAKSDIDFQIEYTPKTTDVASRVNYGNITMFPTPSKYLHPFPSNYELRSSKFVNEFCMGNLERLFIVSKNKVSDSKQELNNSQECSSYSQFKIDKTKSNIKVLLLSSSNETVDKLNSIAPALGITSNVELLENAYLNNNSDNKETYDLVLIVEEKESNPPKVLLGTPLKLSKKLGCSLQKEFGANIEQTSLNVNVDSENIVLLLVDELDTQKLITSISEFSS